MAWIKRSTVLTLFVIVTSTLVAVLVAEMALRQIFPPARAWKFPQEEYQFDSEIGHRLVANQRAYTHDQPVLINSQGLRDREYAERAESATVRILALGDSQTFGNGLPIEDTWPKNLERILNENRPGNRWEVINAGLPGSDTWQHEILMRRLLTQYHPAAVVLGFYVNDVSESFVPRPSAARITNTFSKRISYALRGSVLALLAHKAINQVRAGWRPGADSVHENAVVNGLPLQGVARAWQQVDRSLAAMQAYATAHRVSFILAVIPRRDMLASEKGAGAFNTQVRTIAERHGIRAVDLLGPLQQAYREAGSTLFIPWDGHNSSVANQAIATELASALKGIHPRGEIRRPASGSRSQAQPRTR